MVKRNYFCPGCGKTINKNQEYCFDCKPRKKLEYKNPSIKYCLNCEKINPLNNWGKFDTFEQGLNNAIKKSIKSKNYIIESIEVPKIEKKPGVNYTATIKIIFDEQEFLIEGNILVTTCPKCSTINDTYLEGIIQLRNCNDKIKEFIFDYVNKNEMKGVNINKHNIVSGGEDFVFNNKRQMKRLAEQINKRFKGELKQSAQHFSQDRQTSKVIYRLNILFRQTDEEKENT